MIDWLKVLLLFMGFSLMGWVCLIYGLFRDRWFRRKLERETEEAQARIVRYTVKAVSSGRTTRKGFFPVLSFPVNGVETVGADGVVRSRRAQAPAPYPGRQRDRPRHEAHRLVLHPGCGRAEPGHRRLRIP